MTDVPQLASDVGVVLLNMGGPESEEDVRPFLQELFNDPAILGVPWPVRPLLAGFIAWRRAPHSRERYRRLGGSSPLLGACAEQARALEALLGCPVRAAMRYRHPSAAEALDSLQRRGAQRVIALPLFPQFSTTTTATALDAIGRAADAISMDLASVEAYPALDGLIEALAEAVTEAAASLPALGDVGAHLLFVAHGIPLSRVRRGDPYPDQVATTASAVVDRLGIDLPWSLAFQSRVGPARWLEPDMEDEVRRLADQGVRALVVQPLSFTSENLETLDDLDRDLAEVARDARITLFRRGAAPGTHPAYIGGLRDLALELAQERGWQ
jgi:protoporphyrin/coproporphyrin ferrochelatase